jgi:hypothetical protein
VADEQQLALIKQGADVWNAWRERNPSTSVDLIDADLTGAPNLMGADLFGAIMLGANLAGADLSGAALGRANLGGALLGQANLTDAQLSSADLRRADLPGARLCRADLAGARLVEANLTKANLTQADLSGANLFMASLEGADLTHAHCSRTILADLDLSQALGLESIAHHGPSVIDHCTLERSGPLPLSFLLGCGLPDRLIDYLPSLLNARPIEFYSVFISYSTANQDFAARLHADLQARGVRCWFAPHDMKAGKKIHDQIDNAIRVYDRLLLILSPESMSSRWVKTEIEKAHAKEVHLNRNVLFPISLVPFDEIRRWRQDDGDVGEDIARRVRDYFIPDFTGWTNHGMYLVSFEKLIESLKNADSEAPGGEAAGAGRGA